MGRHNYEPIGTRFFDAGSQRHMVLVADEEPRESIRGWLCYRHADGQWVTLRKATADDRARVAGAAAVPAGFHGVSFVEARRIAMEQAAATEGRLRADRERYIANDTTCSCGQCDCMGEQIARKDAEIERMRAILRRHQWSHLMGAGCGYCPECLGFRNTDGHAEGCELAALIGDPHSQAAARRGHGTQTKTALPDEPAVAHGEDKDTRPSSCAAQPWHPDPDP